MTKEREEFVSRVAHTPVRLSKPNDNESRYYPNCNEGVERVYHTMAQMLAIAVDERQDDWGLHRPHAQFAHSNSVSAATGLAPNEVHMGRLPRLPLDGFRPYWCRGTPESGPVTTWFIATWLMTRKRARTTLSAHTTPAPFLVLTAETLPSPTRCIQHLTSMWVVWHGCTILPLPSVRV